MTLPQVLGIISTIAVLIMVVYAFWQKTKLIVIPINLVLFIITLAIALFEDSKMWHLPLIWGLGWLIPVLVCIAVLRTSTDEPDW